MRGVSWGAVAVAALVVAVPVHAARADGSLARARAAIGASDYMTGRAALAEALAAGDAAPADLVEIYQLSGFIAAALGDSPTAVGAFKRMLALSPTATLPVGTSPKITKQFELAREFYASNKPLQLEVHTVASPPAAHISIVSDPMQMCVHVRAIVRVDGVAAKVIDTGVTQPNLIIALPHGTRLELRVVALDEFGNRLFEVGSETDPLVIVGEPPTPPIVVVVPPHDEGRPIYLQWWLSASVSGAFALAGVGFTVGALHAEHDLQSQIGPAYTYSDAKSIESRGKRDIAIADIGYGVAGAFALGAVALLLLAPHTSESSTVTPVPTRGGGAILWEVSF